MHIPDMGVRLMVGTRAHKKFVMREFKSAGMTDAFYNLAFEDTPVHTTFERCQNDLETAMGLFEQHPNFLSWHMLMTNGIFLWNIVEHPPFVQRYPEIAANVTRSPGPAAAVSRRMVPNIVRAT